MKLFNRKLRYGALGSIFFPIMAAATPSTTYWAPSTATCQPWAVPHVTYDSYFAKNASYPTDYGLTTGFLPFDKIQGEVGFDLLYPSQDPLFLNGKLCMPESSLFRHSPALSAGIYNLGTHGDVSNFDILHVMAQKSLPWGGYVAAGVYHGLTKSLFQNSDGNTVQTGLMAAMTSPDIEIGLTGLKKINFAGDIQTGKNAFGAWGVGTYIYFADNVDLLTGPVFFLDRNLQPGRDSMLWTLQLDIDISLTRAKGVPLSQ